MNIAMFTNAYDPMMGGLERSVDTFAEDLRRMGHRVLIVTLTFRGANASEKDVFRLPALHEVGGTDYSIRIPIPAGLRTRLDDFEPDIVHSHHPFMLGDTALRCARSRGLPLIFTHHTLYERYTYLFQRDSETLERLAMAIATEYANLCDAAIAPTESIRQLMTRRGVHVPVEIIPTGTDTETYGNGRRGLFRKKHGIPENAFVLGYVGRVVEAKNMDYLTEAAIVFLRSCPDAWYLVVGQGESLSAMKKRFREERVLARVVMPGELRGMAVPDAYAAMDVFAFASMTDTQGIVLVESLSAGVPVVALDAPGARDILEDGRSGAVLDADTTPAEFAERLANLAGNRELLARWGRAAIERAACFDRRLCAERLAGLYRRAVDRFARQRTDEEPPLWPQLQGQFAAEWDLMKEKLAAFAAAVSNNGGSPWGLTH